MSLRSSRKQDGGDSASLFGSLVLKNGSLAKLSYEKTSNLLLTQFKVCCNISSRRLDTRPNWSAECRAYISASFPYPTPSHARRKTIRYFAIPTSGDFSNSLGTQTFHIRNPPFETHTYKTLSKISAISLYESVSPPHKPSQSPSSQEHTPPPPPSSPHPPPALC